jgi:NAD(P)-dependent dehydrogenase (short-subunit alcohol dehydrogenase family)
MSRIRTPFDWQSTASAVVEGIDLRGKTALVTGASSGIGVETARALAGAGARVTLGVRNLEAGEKAAAEIRASTGSQDLDVARLDLADRTTIGTFADSWRGPLHILVNNAGIMFTPFERTAEGREIQFATNHLGHFELALRLRPALAEAGGARIVALSSAGHLICPVVFDDLDFRFRRYDSMQAYGQSKTANALFAVEASRRWAADGITANAVMPGNIATGLQKHVTPEMVENNEGFETIPLKTVEQGAATSVLVATSPLLDGIGGRYFEDCAEAEVVTEGGDWTSGVAGYALDPGNAERLWQVSLDLLGLGTP